jgi:hypothetical protein
VNEVSVFWGGWGVNSQRGLVVFSKLPTFGSRQ